MEKAAVVKEARKRCHLMLDSERQRRLNNTKTSLQKGEFLTRMMIFGNSTSKVIEATVRGPSMTSVEESDMCTREVIGPSWRGVFVVSGNYSGKIVGLEAFVPKLSPQKYDKVIRSMPRSLCFKVQKNTKALWPKNFDELKANDRIIALYIFTESPSDRSETDYSNLVEYMIADDQCMTADIGRFKLIVFTSLDLLPPEHWLIEGKHYLWGMFRRKKLPINHPSKFLKPCSVTDSNGVGISGGNTELQNVKSPIKLSVKLGSLCKAKHTKNSCKDTKPATHMKMTTRTDVLHNLVIPKKPRSRKPKTTSSIKEVDLCKGTGSSLRATEPLVSSFMENPNEIAKGVVLLVSQSGEIIWRNHTSCHFLEMIQDQDPLFQYDTMESLLDLPELSPSSLNELRLYLDAFRTEKREFEERLESCKKR